MLSQAVLELIWMIHIDHNESQKPPMPQTIGATYFQALHLINEMLWRTINLLEHAPLQI